MHENVTTFSVIFSECCNMLMTIDAFLWGENKFLSLDYIIEHGQRLTQNSN